MRHSSTQFVFNHFKIFCANTTYCYGYYIYFFTFGRILYSRWHPTHDPTSRIRSWGLFLSNPAAESTILRWLLPQTQQKHVTKLMTLHSGIYVKYAEFKFIVAILGNKVDAPGAFCLISAYQVGCNVYISVHSVIYTRLETRDGIVPCKQCLVTISITYQKLCTLLTLYCVLLWLGKHWPT